MTLFAADFLNVLVPIVFAIIWVIAQAMGSNQQQQQRKAGGQQRRREEGGQRRELQDFLRELGVDSSQTEAETRTRRRRAVATVAGPAAEEQAANERLREHHLHSELERRHREELQSSLAQQQELSRLAAEMEARGRSASPAEMASVSTRRVPFDPVMIAMITGRETFPRAYMLGQVLGPPPGLEE